MVEFIDWLVDPDPAKGSQNQWAEAHDLSGTTLSKWRHGDAAFQSALNQRLARDHLDPVTMASAITALKKKANQGDVQAFKAILDYLKWLDPKPTSAVDDKPIEQFDDAELEALAQELVERGVSE